MDPTTFSISENQKTSPFSQVFLLNKVLLITAQENDPCPDGSSACQPPLAQPKEKPTVNTLNEVPLKNGAQKGQPLFANSSDPSGSHEPCNEIEFCYLTIKEALNRNRQRLLFRQ